VFGSGLLLLFLSQSRHPGLFLAALFTFPPRHAPHDRRLLNEEVRRVQYEASGIHGLTRVSSLCSHVSQPFSTCHKGRRKLLWHAGASVLPYAGDVLPGYLLPWESEGPIGDHRGHEHLEPYSVNWSPTQKLAARRTEMGRWPSSRFFGSFTVFLLHTVSITAHQFLVPQS